MFIALRDIKFAKGRFALIATVVALLTLLVGFLTGLTAGLANQNISSMTNLDATHIALSTPSDGDKLAFSNSSLTKENIQDLKNLNNVSKIEELGISRAKFLNKDEHGKNLNASIFGTNNSYGKDTPTQNNKIIVSENAAKEANLQEGDTLRLADKEFTIQKISEESWYSHSPVVWMTMSDWSDYSIKTGQSGDPTAAVLNVTGDLPHIDGVTIETKLKSLMALDAFKSEIGSLGMMVGMLFAISALITGAFFTVWTIQRKGDIAILKALGVSNKALVRDSLGQAFIILILGIGSGILVTIILGSLISGTLPFVLSPLTMVIPAIAMMGTGILGAAFALRSVTKADPLTALAGNR